MMGFFEITPQKTEKLNLKCRVCNTPESNDYILDSLTERQDFLMENGLKLEYDDALFSSRNEKYKGAYKESSLSSILSRKNKMLQEHHKKLLSNKYENKEITYKEYKKRLENLPKFHAHALRHFFTTTVRNYTTNRDISLIMEGHTSPYKMDKHYVGENEDMFNDAMIKETYEKIIPYLTFNLDISLEEYNELHETQKQYKNQLEKNNELECKYERLSSMVEKVLNGSGSNVWDKLD